MTFEPSKTPSGVDFLSNSPPTMTARAALEINWRQKFLLGAVGLSPSLLQKFGDDSDLTAQCNRGAAEIALLAYLFTIFVVALQTVFGEPGTISVIHVLIAFGLTCVFQRMDAFLHVRGLYHAGKQEVIKGGLRLSFGRDDVAWYAAVTARSLVGLAAALVAGTIAGQTMFGPEIAAQLTSSAASKNAFLIAEYTKTFDRDLNALSDAAKRAADEAASTKKGLEALRAQEVANVREGVRQSRRLPRKRVEDAHAATTSAVQTYETKSAAADKQSEDATTAYGNKLATRGEAIRTMVERDPRFVPFATGLLARLKAARVVASEDSFAKAGIITVDGIGIGLELWVLILFLAQCPSRLSTGLYCDHLKKTTAAARDLATAINPPEPRPDHKPPSDGQPLRRGPGRPPKPKGPNGLDPTHGGAAMPVREPEKASDLFPVTSKRG